MNLLQRAKVSSTRQLGKTLTLFLLIFLIGVIISGAISLQGAVVGIDENMRRNMRPLVSFGLDWERIDAHRASFDEDPLTGFLTPDIVRDIAALPQVAHYIYSVDAWGVNRELSHYHYEGTEGDYDETIISLTGTSTTTVIQMTEGIIELTQGRTFTEDEITTLDEISPILISERFARLNHLEVGSTFALDIEIFELDPENPLWEVLWDELVASRSFSFEVIGIFDITEHKDFTGHHLNEDEQFMLYLRERDRVDELSNMFFVPNNIAEEMYQFELLHRKQALTDFFPESVERMSQTGYAEQVSTLMLLHDPLEIEAFSAAAEPFLPSDYWGIITMTNDFDQVAMTMENMQQSASWVLWGAVGATVLILSLLMFLFLHDRKREMGIYLALGEKRSKMLMQVLVEVVVISFIAMSLAIVVGNVVSDVISRELLRVEVLMPRERERNDIFDRVGFMQSEPDIYPDELMEIFDTSLDVASIVIFYVIGLGTIVLATAVPLMHVIKLNPKNVLM